jgi:hypothetical protein
VPAPYEEVDVKKEWLVPLTGVVFVGLAIASFAIGGEPPDADEPVREIVDHYVDNKDSVRVGALGAGLAVLSLIFFGGYVRKVLAAAEGPGGMLSALALVGTSIMAVGIAIDATISLALAEAVEDIDPAAVQALQALWDNDFIPIALGTLVFLLSTGISIVRHGALPKWLGWVAILLAVVGPTPIGFASFLGGGIWILVVSVLLALKARAAGSTGGPTAAAA